ncbi:MAG: pilus assembly protein TadG-related protein [Oligoflexia bacterium]|nr:pilus assembly protein TadG-related protein [Oligoflexia bacterium]
MYFSFKSKASTSYKKRILKDQTGQASLFMALFATTMILLFAFTTNIGMLVHAKINLQNAADSAAYAGAAVQARQLTAAAYLNWEMRRAVKEFLYYYMIRSQYAAMPCFPTTVTGQIIGPCASAFGTPSGDARHHFEFKDPRETINETNGPFIPTVCIIFDPNNNYCQKAGVPGIPEFQGSGSFGVADPIVAAVKNATNQIIDRKIQDCLGRTDINRQFLIAWLFNLDPNPILLTVGNDSADPFPFTPGLERVGVLPRMAILRARIDNIEEALNLDLSIEGLGSVTLTESAMGSFRGLVGGNKTLDYFERPIQAYLSAKNNLPSVDKDNGIFSEVELTELLPNRGGAAQNPNLKNPPTLVKFNNIYTRASFANSRFETRPGSGLDRGNCFQVREIRTIPRFPFGITKDPNVLTYYAVRLQAKTRLLFSPFGGNGIVTLSAYSAAKPFGSRIGKDLDPTPSSDFKPMLVARGKLVQGDSLASSAFANRFPNVLVSSDDYDAEVAGFARNGHLGYIRGAMTSYNRADYGPRLAGAYAPWEIGYYTVPANFQTPDAMGLFEDNPTYYGKYYTQSAGIFPVNGSISNDLSFLRDRVYQNLVGSIADELTLRGQFQAFLDAVLSDASWANLFNYMDSTDQVRNHYIPDPLLNDEPDLRQYAKLYGSRYTVAGMDQDQRRQMTSWNNQKTAADTALGIQPESELGLDIGRSGYSVRFISFDSLRTGGRTTNDPEIGVDWTNPFDRLDAGAAGPRILDDISKLKH